MWLNKVLHFSIKVSRVYQPSHRKLIPKGITGLIYDQNMESNLNLILKESDVFGLIFLDDGVTISRTLLLNILVS